MDGNDLARADVAAEIERRNMMQREQLLYQSPPGLVSGLVPRGRGGR